MSENIDVVLSKAGLEPKLIDEIVTIGRLKKAKAGHVLMGPDSTGNEIPIVLSGLLKVMRQDSNGEEIFLYYLEGGETCAMSITCCIEGEKAGYKVIAEEDSTIWMIPMTYLDSWVTKYPSFRRFVFGSYQLRFEELLKTIDSIAFHKMDERVYKYLLDTKQATGSFEVHKTHEQIANELNTSRVVVSRLLKQLEKDGRIEQYRNRIEIL
ncbi:MULTISPECIES: Crp/Fnr family transcriptional regulator [unclassified Ekhidna]|jgi:CRP/FNR family transcriptional regulator|uniref:Crp/Fnr family transcriptional regulator n=1 Tax=unclassified Ekhidna TaxID=2632188 RepID=UPI0032DF9D2F